MRTLNLQWVQHKCDQHLARATKPALPHAKAFSELPQCPVSIFETYLILKRFHLSLHSSRSSRLLRIIFKIHHSPLSAIALWFNAFCNNYMSASIARSRAHKDTQIRTLSGKSRTIRH
ncbi:Hypothetical_protein [Hexamita inflata]|uniref:Hypothetical_protein n=1 Tax=Hexamita inflata TaxID=28002 RepID=A0AA86VA47_9EUKA|nr:Hypothetical protein HINF_LOCUS48393 [Hexamita inflata]CAI9960750.1 Hypothetical protein HINF_LOCUS48395 [Hexamita inflata]